MLDVEEMKKMLLDPKCTLSEIAEKMGYDSLQTLSSDFKKAVGMTPSRYIRFNESSNSYESKS